MIHGFREQAESEAGVSGSSCWPFRMCAVAACPGSMYVCILSLCMQASCMPSKSEARFDAHVCV
jgi:hypothetical protein